MLSCKFDAYLRNAFSLKHLRRTASDLVQLTFRTKCLQVYHMKRFYRYSLSIFHGEGIFFSVFFRFLLAHFKLVLYFYTRCALKAAETVKISVDLRA